MRIDLEFVELHAPFFFDGVNYGQKLFADNKKNKRPIEMWYDTELEKTIIVSNNKVGIIEATAVMQVADYDLFAKDVLQKTKKNTAVPVTSFTADVGIINAGPITAQVSTPHDKVQGGVITKRRPKFQGEGTQGE